MTRFRPALLGFAALIGLAGAGAAQETRPDLLLVRCAERSRLACLTTTLEFEAALARRMRGTQAGAPDTAWRVRIRGDTAVPAYGRRFAAPGNRPARVLLLVDVSGSMRNLGIGTAKIVIKDNLLFPLDSVAGGGVRVAVAPFGSVDVARRIEAASFVTPREAVAQVEGLPPPERENTGLYSAVALGASRLERELALVGSDALGVLVVLTDGDNDVGGTGDDPDLLDGPEGLAQAAAAVARSAVVPWIIGVGSRVSAAPLERLAGERGRSYVVPLDAYQLAQPLAETRDLLATTWEVAFRVPAGGREELGRGWLIAGVRHLVGAPAGGPVAVWRPPVIALPAFSGTVTPGVIPEGLVQQAGRTLDRRIPLLGFLAVLLALLWLVLPRLLWPPIVPAGASDKPAKKAAPTSAGGLRVDVKEAPPRRPADVTATRARAAT